MTEMSAVFDFWSIFSKILIIPKIRAVSLLSLYECNSMDNIYEN